MPKKQRRTVNLQTIIKTAQYAIDERLAQEIPKVLDMLLLAVKNPAFEPRDRIAAAKFLLEYFMPKQKAPLVQVNQQITPTVIKHISHLGIPADAAEIPEGMPDPPPRRQLVELSAVDASDMLPERHDRFEPVPQDQLPPTDVSMITLPTEEREAPIEVAPLLARDQPKWRKRFW